MAFEKSKEIARSFKRELIVYQRVLRDERTPGRTKFLLGLAIAYVCMPFDLIPDFIPVIGHLDDAVIVPALVIMALRSVPGDLISEHRRLVNCEEAEGRRHKLNVGLLHVCGFLERIAGDLCDPDRHREAGNSRTLPPSNCE